MNTFCNAKETTIKRNLTIITAALLILTQCAATKETWTRPVPSIEDVFRTASHEERVLKLYHAVKALDDVPYVWGGSSPQWGMDCSGFTQYVMREVGVNIPRTVSEQVALGEEVPERHLMPGDLLFFDADEDREGADHVGIYMGRGYFAHYKSPVGVTIEKLDDYEHGIMLAKRVMHERTGAYADRGPDTVARTYPSTWERTRRRTVIRDGCENAERNELPEKLAEDRRDVKKRDAGSGKLVGIRLEGEQVLYTVRRDDGSEYEFYVDRDNHLDSTSTHPNLLGMEIEWDEEYYNIRGW